MLLMMMLLLGDVPTDDILVDDFKESSFRRKDREGNLPNLTHPYFLDTGKTLRHILFSTIRDRLHYFWIASQKGEPCM